MSDERKSALATIMRLSGDGLLRLKRADLTNLYYHATNQHGQDIKSSPATKAALVEELKKLRQSMLQEVKSRHYEQFMADRESRYDKAKRLASEDWAKRNAEQTARVNSVFDGFPRIAPL